MSGSRAPKGTGSVRALNGRWQAMLSFVDAGGERRRRSQMFDTRTEARAWLRDATARAARGRVDSEHTVGEYLADWVAALPLTGLEANTISWYRSAVQRHIIPALGGVRLDRLTATRIEAFLAEKVERGRLDGRGGLGPTSVRRLQVTLSKALGDAWRKGMLAENPMARVEAPKVPARDVTASVWAPDDISMFLEATRTDREAPLWQTATMTGLRREELAGLRWGDVDLEAGVVSVRRARVEVDGRVIEKGPKSAASRRTVDLDSETVAVLRRWKVAQLEERLRAGTAWHGGGWVFSDELGAPWHPDRITKTFGRTLRRLGLPPTDIKGLRHAHATALLKAGVHHKVVQERLGHSSSRVTLDIYSAVLPGMQREAVEKLADLIGRR